MTPSGRAFDHVLIIMFENQFRSYVMDNEYMAWLAAQGIDMVSYFGVMHPSQTNYIASIAGELCNVTDDDRPTPPLSQRTVVDLIEDAEGDLQWKAYMDAYVPETTPWSADLVPTDAYPYVLKHNPFASFQRILESRDRWERVVGEDQLWRDLVAGTLPEYAWFTPDMWNDGHYLVGTHQESKPRAPGLVDQAADWLRGFFGRMGFPDPTTEPPTPVPGPRSQLPPRTLVVVTFDEADFEGEFDEGRKYTYDGPNQIYTVLLGDGITPGVESEAYNHYSLLRTVEKNFGLESLGKNDADANWFQFLWGRHFAWGEPADTPLRATGPIAAVGVDDVLHVVFAESGGALRHVAWDGSSWSDGVEVGISCDGPLALVAVGEELTLFARNANGSVEAAGFRPVFGWSAPHTVVETPVAALAAASVGPDGCVMLVWSAADGSLHSRRRSGDTWGTVVPVAGHVTTGAIQLAVLGPSLYLIHQAAGGRMDVVSYNTAAFNVVNVPDGAYGGPYDDTTVDDWSPSAFPVSHFSRGSASGSEREGDLRESYTGGAPLVAATLDGVIHLVHPGADDPALQTETFSLSGVMTPALPVAYGKSDEKTTSNGYGTLAQAGWSEQRPLGCAVHRGPGLALAAVTGAVILLSAPENGGAVTLTVGRYTEAASSSG